MAIYYKSKAPYIVGGKKYFYGNKVKDSREGKSLAKRMPSLFTEVDESKKLSVTELLEEMSKLNNNKEDRKDKGLKFEWVVRLKADKEEKKEDLKTAAEMLGLEVQDDLKKADLVDLINNRNNE